MCNSKAISNFGLRSSAILTDAYVAGTVVPNCETYRTCTVYLAFTKGSLTTLEVKVEQSVDGTDYYQDTFNSDPTAGVVTNAVVIHQFDATGKFNFTVPVTGRYVKVSAKGTGTVTNSLLSLNAVFAN